MNHAEAGKFAEQWASDWNAHDLESVLSHFREDVVFTSPIAAQVLDDCDGIIRGKPALRRYWAQGLHRIPNLHFEVESVYTGVDTVVINYRNHLGNLVNEILIFDGPHIVEGHATYLTKDAATDSGVVNTR